jgi:hypothetical protein
MPYIMSFYYENKNEIRIVSVEAVLRIRIHRIHMFLGLQDPDPDPMSWIRNIG